MGTLLATSQLARSTSWKSAHRDSLPTNPSRKTQWSGLASNGCESSGVSPGIATSLPLGVSAPPESWEGVSKASHSPAAWSLAPLLLEVRCTSRGSPSQSSTPSGAELGVCVWHLQSLVLCATLDAWCVAESRWVVPLGIPDRRDGQPRTRKSLTQPSGAGQVLSEGLRGTAVRTKPTP